MKKENRSGVCASVFFVFHKAPIKFTTRPYVGSQTSYQVDIISSKWEEISAYAQDELGRGCTIIPAKGGYKGEDRPILRIVFEKSQYHLIRTFIAKVDKKAFFTSTRTNAVFGEGFKPHQNENLFTKKDGNK